MRWRNGKVYDTFCIDEPSEEEGTGANKDGFKSILSQDIEGGMVREGFRCSSFEDDDSAIDTGARDISDDDHPLTMYARKRKSIMDQDDLMDSDHEIEAHDRADQARQMKRGLMD